MSERPEGSAPALAPPRPTLAARLAAALRPSTIAWAIPGPIFHKEMWLSGRRGGTYLIRCLYTLLLIGIVAFVYTVSRVESYGGSVQQVQQFQDIAPTIGYVMAWFQYGALVLAAIIFGAPLICDEKRAGTLGTLLTTPLRAWQVILGKLASTMVQLVILALVSMPVLLGIRLYGGLTAQFVLGATALTVSAAVLAGALAIFHSIGAKRAPAAAAAALFSFILLQGLVPLVLLLLMKLNVAFDPFLFAAGSSPGALGVMYAELRPMAFGVPITYVWVSAACLNVVYTTLVYGAASVRLRLVLREEGEAGATIPTAMPPSARSSSTPPPLPTTSRTVGDNPVYWREAQQPIVRRAWQMWAAGAVVVTALLWAYIETGWDNLHTQVLHYPVIIIGLSVSLLLSIFGSAGQFAGERESRTWDALACTPLSAWEIVVGKYLGFLRRQVLVPAVVMAHFALMSVCLKVNPFIMILLPLAILAPLAATAATGVYFSTVFSKSVRAAAANFAFWVGVFGGLPMIAGILAIGVSNEEPLFAVALFPNALGMAIVTATGLVRDWDGSDWANRFDYYGFARMHAPAFLALFFGYLVLYAGVSFFALRLAANRVARTTGRRG